MGYAGRRRDVSRYRIGQDRTKIKRTIGRSISRIAPDRAEIKIGGPPPLPQGTLEWNKNRNARRLKK